MSTTATITTTNCRHCGKPASRHYYGGWCAPAPDRIPSLSGGGICPPREVRTKYEASDTCAIRGCDRLRSSAPDHDGDLCGDHRAAEVALGRGPVPT
mgnify:FL=1